MDLIIKIIIIIFSVIILLTVVYFSIKDDKMSPEKKKNDNKSEYSMNETLNNVKDGNKKNNKSENIGNIHKNKKLSDTEKIKNKQNILSSNDTNADNFYKIEPGTSSMNKQTNINYSQGSINKTSIGQKKHMNKSSLTQEKHMNKSSLIQQQSIKSSSLTQQQPTKSSFSTRKQPIKSSSLTQKQPITTSSIGRKKLIVRPTLAVTKPTTESFSVKKEATTEQPFSQQKPTTTPATFEKNIPGGKSEFNKPIQKNGPNQTQETVYNLCPFIPQGFSENYPSSQQKTNAEAKPQSWIYKRMKTGDEEDLKNLFQQEPQYENIDNYQEIVSKWTNGSFFSYIKNKSQINFNLVVWLPFKSETIQELRNKLYTILKKENIKKIKSNTTISNPNPNVKNIDTLSMNNNACYLISILYMIKANKKLLEFISTYCNDAVYKKNLLNYLQKDQKHTMTKKEFDIFVNYTEWNFSYNRQDDPNMFLLHLLEKKCNLSKLQFAFLGNLLITKTGAIQNDETYDTQQTVKFSGSSFGLTLPVIELCMNKPSFNYNIQDILFGTKINMLAASKENLYLMPIFTTAPPFLCIKIVPSGYNDKDFDDFDDYKDGKLVGTSKKLVYKFYKDGNLIFQDEIYLRSLLHGESKYKLTGFLVYRLYKSSNNLDGHYIPYFKIGNKWVCNYFDIRKDVTNEIKFPLNMKDDERFIVSALFYEHLA